MKKLKILISVLLLTASVLVIAFRITQIQSRNSNGLIKVFHFDVEQKEIERRLTIEDFKGIDLGTSLEKIENIIGEPNGWIGSGIPTPFYTIGHNKYIILYFDSPLIYEQLNCITLVNDRKELQIIKNKEQL